MRSLEIDCEVGRFSGAGRRVTSPARLPIIAGPETNLAAVTLLLEAFEKIRPEVVIDPPRSMGSSATIRAVAEGLIAVGLVSRPLRDCEKEWGLTLLPYARTALVWGANPMVEEEGITGNDVVLIYQGVKTRWQNGREIAFLCREPQDSSVEVLQQAIPGFSEVHRNGHEAKRWTTVYSDREMNRVLAVRSGALGLTDMGFTKTHRSLIKVLQFNGILPTAASIESDRYPLVKTLHFVFRRDTLPVQAMAFIQFARSKEAEKILRANGYLPQE